MSTLFDTLSPSEKTNSVKKIGFLFCDGGSRGNPGPAAGAAVLYDENKNVIADTSVYFDHQTNNYAEYQGLIEGLKIAFKNKITDLTVTLDSKLLVEQMNGNWKVKNMNIKPLWIEACSLRDQIPKVIIKHVLRAGNKRADSLVNQELDKNV